MDFNLSSRPDSEICFSELKGFFNFVAGKLINEVDIKYLRPFLVGIYHIHGRGVSFHCNGNLVSRRVLVTAAHCFQTPEKQYDANEFYLLLGQRNVFKDQGSSMATIQKVVIHPHFQSNGESYDADVAVVIMKESVKYSENIRPICLWKATDEKVKTFKISNDEDEEIHIVGWAREDSQTVTAESKCNLVPYGSRDICVRSNNIFESIMSERTMCVYAVTCFISGAGAMKEVKRNNETAYVLWGLSAVALSDPSQMFCDLKQYAVYTNLSYFVDWIEDLIQYAYDN